MKAFRDIISEALRHSINEYIEEDAYDNSQTDFINDVRINLNVKFDNERQKLSRKIKEGEIFINTIEQIHNEIMNNSNFSVQSVYVNSDKYSNSEYDIYYLIDNGENWDDDLMYDNEYELTSQIDNNDYGITVDMVRAENGSVLARMSFDLETLDNMDY